MDTLEFKHYMANVGAVGKYSQNSYCARLRFIERTLKIELTSDNLGREVDIQTLIGKLKDREVTNYADYESIAVLKTALRTYHNFLNADNLEKDIREIQKSNRPDTIKKQLIDARRGQGRFKKDLIKNSMVSAL